MSCLLDCQKTIFYTFAKTRKGLGNKGFPKFNPQSEFTSDEENSTFQGIFMPMERTVYTYSNLVKILILTKGVDFFDTLMPWFPTANLILPDVFLFLRILRSRSFLPIRPQRNPMFPAGFLPQQRQSVLPMFLLPESVPVLP